MAHPILNEHPEWVAIDDDLVALEKQRAEVLAENRARLSAYHEGVTVALAEDKPLPTPPQSAAAISSSFQAQRDRLERRREQWLVDHQADLVEAAHSREDEIMDGVAGAVATLDAAHVELSRLYSMLAGTAYQTRTRSPVTAPQYGPVELIEISRQSRRPLRWNEPAAPADDGRQLVGQVR